MNRIHLVGFGSQGSAWAKCLRQSGWQVEVYLPIQSPSFQKAIEAGFNPHPIEHLYTLKSDLSETHWIAMLCPDPLIAPLYRDFIANFSGNVRLILAHGYAIYSGDLKMRTPLHRPLLLAPKAIGPKLLENYKSTFPHPHSLVAAFFAPALGFDEDQEGLTRIARGLGFSPESLVTASFDEEAIGDLMSEQGLLCGGIFKLLEWTLEAMTAAGIPERLIREECLSELELIAGLIRERGPSQTFRSISQVAQGGTIAMANRFENSGFKEAFLAQMEEIKNRKFAQSFQSGAWKEKSLDFANRLATLEKRLLEKNGSSS